MSDPGPLFGRNPDAVNVPPFETEDPREDHIANEARYACLSRPHTPALAASAERLGQGRYAAGE